MNRLSMRTNIFQPRSLQGFLVFVLFLANLTAVGLWFFPWRSAIQDPDGSQIKIMIVVNSLLWIFSALVILYDLKRESVLKNYLLAWKKQRFVLAFILVAFCSIFWSISPLISAYKVLILVCASLLGSFIGFQLNLARWSDVLAWFGGILLFLSIAFALLLPGLGTLLTTLNYGAWAGIYWHKNQLGSMMALVNALFLMRAISGIRVNRLQAGLDFFLYLLSLVVVYLAASAAGIMITFVLNVLIVVIIVWLKVYPRLKRAHYLGLLGLSVLGVVLGAANLDFVFGLLNRSSSLTGRVPMWSFLFRNVISGSPWIGYGFGALWSTASFVEGMKQALGWTYPLGIADNGFIDILLSVGLIGLLIFLGILILACMRSVRHALEHRTLIDFFPLVFVVFALLANLSFSLFLETEAFVWLCLLAVLFMPQVSKQ